MLNDRRTALVGGKSPKYPTSNYVLITFAYVENYSSHVHFTLYEVDCVAAASNFHVTFCTGFCSDNSLICHVTNDKEHSTQTNAHIKGTSQIKGKTSGKLNVALHTKYKVQTIVHSHLYGLPNDKCSLCLARCVSLNSPRIICMRRYVNGVKGANVSSV